MWTMPEPRSGAWHRPGGAPAPPVLAGICAELAATLGWHAQNLRFLWVVATVLTGGLPGLLAYGLLALATAPAADEGGRRHRSPAGRRPRAPQIRRRPSAARAR